MFDQFGGSYAFGRERPATRVVVWFRENRGVVSLSIDASRINSFITVPTNLRPAEVTRKSSEIRESFAALARSDLSQESLRRRAYEVEADADLLFGELLNQHFFDKTNPRRVGEDSALSVLRDVISKARTQKGPIDFIVADTTDYLPWELLTVDRQSDKNIRLGDVAWVTRAVVNEAVTHQLFRQPEYQRIKTTKGLRVALYVDEDLSGARQEAERIRAISRLHVEEPRNCSTAESVAGDFADRALSGITIAHFAGHCELYAKARRGKPTPGINPDFYLSTSGTPSVHVTNRHFSDAIESRRARLKLPVVILNVCMGGSTDPEVRSPAQHFIGWGAPAVISAPDLINDEAAPLFAKTLYEVLAEKLTSAPHRIWLTEALYLTRQKLKQYAHEDASLVREEKRLAQDAISRLVPHTFSVTVRDGDVLLTSKG